jgi:ATP adenylyltransferase
LSLERLWAGWRSGYLAEAASAPPSDDCLFCRLAGEDPDEAQLVARGTTAYAVLNAYPYTSGHVMVAPLRHEAALQALARDEADELMAMTQQATAAVQAAYAPDGINVGMNLGRAAGAGIPGHLHVHVLPRWVGDTNFMTSVAETRVVPEPLAATLGRLRAAWPAAGGAGEESGRGVG